MKKIIFLCLLSISLMAQENVSYLVVIMPKTKLDGAVGSAVCTYLAKWRYDMNPTNTVDIAYINKMKNSFVVDTIYNKSNPSVIYTIATFPLSELTGATKEGVELALSPETTSAIISKLAAVDVIIFGTKGANFDTQLSQRGFSYKNKVWVP